MAELQPLPRSGAWSGTTVSPPWGVQEEVLQFLVDFVSALLLLTEGGLEMGTEGEGENALNEFILFRRRCIP